jgi:EF hand
MWRYFIGAGAALLLAGAGFFLWTGQANDEQGQAIPPPGAAAGSGPVAAGGPAPPPAADARDREQRRFDRVDRDNDGRVTLDEMVYGRRRAYTRLDTNHDGQLSFEEWAARTLQKFGEVDANHDRSLNRPEFAATAPRRRPAARRANCDCTHAAPAPADDDAG